MKILFKQLNKRSNNECQVLYVVIFVFLTEINESYRTQLSMSNIPSHLDGIMDIILICTVVPN